MVDEVLWLTLDRCWCIILELAEQIVGGKRPDVERMYVPWGSPCTIPETTDAVEPWADTGTGNPIL